MDEKRFNVRVYGVIVNRRNEILVSDEYHYNTFMRKFPGGGLQFGEGPRSALQRELQEELGFSLHTLTHFHTTDIFVQSVFNKDHQVLGIYFTGRALPDMEELYREAPLTPTLNGMEIFHWKSVEAIDPDEFTFPVDKQAMRVFLELLESGRLII